MSEYRTLRKQKRRLGLLYGILAGLVFSAVAWGVDAVLLARAHAGLPWLKFLIGVLFCAGLGGLVGWLAEIIDNALLTLLAWVATGIVFAWFSSHLPFEISTAVIGVTTPEFRGLALYPYPPNVDSIMVVIYLVVVLCAGLTGALQNNLVESARGAAYPAARFLTLGVCIPLMALAGNSADNINEPMRNAMISVDQVISNALQAEITPVDKETAADMRLKAVDPIKKLIHRSRRLVLGSYDLQDMDAFGVYVDFDGEWATCSVLIDNPSVCTPSDQLYPLYLNCLLDPEFRADPAHQNTCKVSAGPAAQAWLETHAPEIGRPQAAQVLAQQGDVTLLKVLGEHGVVYGCRFSGFQYTTVLQSCAPEGDEGKTFAFRPTPTRPPVQPSPTPEAPPPATPTEGAIPPTGTQPAPEATPTLPEQQTTATIIGSQPDFQSAAMLPDARTDLPSLADLTRYSIQVKIDWAGHSFLGHSQVVYTNTENVSLDSLYFRLLPNGGGSYGNGSLTVDRFIKDGQPLEPSLSLEDSVLEARLPAPMEPGERSLLEMDFSGTVPVNFGETGYGIYDFTEGVMALANWYPILAVYDEDGWNLDPVSSIGDSVYADMAFYTVEATFEAAQEESLVAASTGAEVSRSQDPSQMTVTYASGPVREFFLVVSDRFQMSSQAVSGTTVNSYYLPGHEAAGREALDVAVKSLEAYNELFGLYPYTELDVVDTPMNYAAGVEYPGVILIAQSLYESGRQQVLTVVVAHEVGHQWWYNLVGNDVFDHPWLDEGLTTYTVALYWEAVGGSRGYQAAIDSYQKEYDRIVQEGKDDLVSESLSHFESNAGAGSYGAVVYEKGALFFHIVREAIGDQAFFDGLRAYFKEHEYGIALPKDLLAAFERTAGRQLDEIYQEWLYSKK